MGSSGETFGDAVDSWAITRGDAPSMAHLEQQLKDVKTIFEAKFGACNLDRPGVWDVSKYSDVPSLNDLEAELESVKAMYLVEFGKTIDAEQYIVSTQSSARIWDP